STAWTRKSLRQPRHWRPRSMPMSARSTRRARPWPRLRRTGAHPRTPGDDRRGGRTLNILILGGGGREHALAWAFAQNPRCDRIWCAPGNAGIAEVATCVALDILNGERVLAFVRENDVGFVVVGPEAPLVEGVADVLRATGVLTFGPGRAAARLEASKAFTKEICAACGAPTAASRTFTDPLAARAYLAQEGAPIVVKADGLAAGKGVTVAMTLAEAEAALDAIFADGP